MQNGLENESESVQDVDFEHVDKEQYLLCVPLVKIMCYHGSSGQLTREQPNFDAGCTRAVVFP